MKKQVGLDTVGKRLQYFLTARGMTQQELADCTGLSRQSISNYFLDKTPPSLENLIRFSDVLKTTPNDLLGYVPHTDIDDSLVLSQEDKKMVLDIRTLDERGKATVLAEIRQQQQYVETASSELSFKNYISRNSANITYPIFLQPADADYRAMKSRATELRRLKKTSYRSYEDVTKFLWDLGYGENICLAYVIQIFMGTRIISRQLFTHISTYLKHEVLYSFEE